MNAPINPLHRLVAVIGTVAALAMVVAASFLFPGSTWTQADEPDPVTPQPLQTIPPVQPPAIQVNPPVATPVPGAAAAGAGAQARGSDLEAVKFRPQVRLIEGQRPALPQGADKPKTEGRTDASKPSAGKEVGPKEPYASPDYGQLLDPQDWSIRLYEGFEGAFPGFWILEDHSEDGYERLWGDTNYMAQIDFWSAWPAARGADALDPWYDWYVDNLNSWMKVGPLDFGNMTDIFVGFGLWYDTEPDWDWMYFCASIDGENYSCDYWSGYSDGWTDQAYWLTSYAGYSEVWLAWVFISDESISEYYEGPFVDEIWVWGDEIDAEPTPEPTPDPAGQLIQNGSFEDPAEDHFVHWVRQSSTASTLEGRPGQLPPLQPDAGSYPPSLVNSEVGVQTVYWITSTSVDGQYSAYLWQPDGLGRDYLYQTFDVPAGITNLVVNYWFAVTAAETGVGRDFYCASLRPAADLDAIWIDLGCLDSIDATGYWQELLYTLTADQVVQVRGETIAIVFEMYNTGTAADWSAGWVDYVRVYAIGGAAAAPLDPSEPNDGPGEATPLICGQTISGTIGDALGGYDVDWFRLDNVPAGRIDVDINARTLIPPSALDSLVGLWDGGVNLLAWNDDDGISYDSYVIYTVASPGSFYVSVQSYSGYGGPDSFYRLTVHCEGTGGGPPPVGNEPEPPPANTWTVMLYLNAEDPGFADVLTKYRTDIEKFIGSKSTWLKVVVLYDGPQGGGNAGTTRYLVQPNGAYTDGVNRWDRGELNMGHPDTLANFVTWAMDQYPAENYYLAVDDHGDGAYGISYDGTSSNDQLTPPELYSALKSATHNGARKIDIFDYEACLMGLAENAYDLRQWVDYVVFFEQISWGINTYPVYFGDLAAADEPEAVGRRIVDRYYQQAMAANGGRGYPHTISLIDTSKMGAVSDAVSAFGNKIMQTNTQAQKDAINGARDRSQAFAADMDATNSRRAEYIDLYDLAVKANSLAPTQAAAVRTAVDNAVVHERHASGRVGGYTWDHNGVHGMSIYYPPIQSSSAFASYVAPTLYQMSQDGTWDEFLNWAVPSGTRRGMSAFRSQDRYFGREDAFVFRYVYLPVVIRQK